MAGLRELLLEAALFSKEWRKARDENKVREAAKLKNDLELIFQDIKIKAAQQELGQAKKEAERETQEYEYKKNIQDQTLKTLGFQLPPRPQAQQVQPQQPRTAAQQIEQMAPSQLESDFQRQYFPEERVQGPMAQLDRSLRQQTPLRVAEPSRTPAIAQVAAGQIPQAAPTAQPRRQPPAPQRPRPQRDIQTPVETEPGKIPTEALRPPLAETIRKDISAQPSQDATNVIQTAKQMTRKGETGVIAVDDTPGKILTSELKRVTNPVDTVSIGQKEEDSVISRLFNAPHFKRQVDMIQSTYQFPNRKMAERMLANQIQSVYRDVLGYEDFIFPGSGEFDEKRYEYRKSADGTVLRIDNLTGTASTIDSLVSTGDKEGPYETIEKMATRLNKTIPKKSPSGNIWTWDELLDFVGAIPPDQQGRYTVIGTEKVDHNFDAYILRKDKQDGTITKVDLGYKKYPELTLEDKSRLTEHGINVLYTDNWETLISREEENIPRWMLPIPTEAGKKFTSVVKEEIVVNKEGIPDPNGQFVMTFDRYYNQGTGKSWTEPILESKVPRKGHWLNPKDQDEISTKILRGIQMDAMFKQYQTINSQFGVMEEGLGVFLKHFTAAEDQIKKAGGLRAELDEKIKTRDVWDAQQGTWKPIDVIWYKPKEGHSLNPASQAIINAFNKILDYASVVRESEYARTPEGQGFLNRIKGFHTRLLRGGPGLAMDEVQSFYDLAEKIKNRFFASYLDHMSPHISKVLRWDNRLTGGRTPADTANMEIGFIQSALAKDLLANLGLPGNPSYEQLRDKYDTYMEMKKEPDETLEEIYAEFDKHEKERPTQ